MSLTGPLHALAESGLCAIGLPAPYFKGLGPFLAQLAVADDQPNTVQFFGGRMRTISRVLGSSVLMVVTACGGGGSSGPGNGGGGGGGGGGTCPANTICMNAGAFTPTSRTVAVNTAVTWTNDSGVEHNVVFTTPSAALGVSGGASGNFIAPSPSTNRRQFAATGTQAFHCTIHGTATSGMRGSVIVQ